MSLNNVYYEPSSAWTEQHSTSPAPERGLCPRKIVQREPEDEFLDLIHEVEPRSLWTADTFRGYVLGLVPTGYQQATTPSTVGDLLVQSADIIIRRIDDSSPILAMPHDVLFRVDMVFSVDELPRGVPSFVPSDFEWLEE